MAVLDLQIRTPFYNQSNCTQDIGGNSSRCDLVDSNMGKDTTNPRLVAGVVVLLLLILNLGGNSLVFYVYRFRVKPSVFAFYVTVIAALDIITSLTTMLIDVIVKVRPLDESVLHLESMCKISHFEVYTQSLISACVLTLIAYQRYRKICRPLEPSLTIRTAKLSLVAITVSCIVLTASMLIINGPQDVQVQQYDQVVNVTICRYDKNYDRSQFQFIFSMFLLIAFSLVLCLLTIFYAMVAKSLKKFERRNSRTTSNAPSSPHVDLINREQGFTMSPTKARQSQLNNQSRTSVVSTGELYEGISAHMYRVFATITVIFIISYLPHLVVLILTITHKLDYKILAFTERLVLDLAYNSPYISTLANPIVYGFHNAEFREHLKRVLTCRI